MNFNQDVISQVYFDVRLPSGICFAVIISLALLVGVGVAVFAHKTSNYVQNMSVRQIYSTGGQDLR